MPNDLRFAIRQLWKAPSFTFTAIAVFAFAIGATTAMFGVFYGFLLRPLPYKNPGQLVQLQSRQGHTGADLGVNYFDFEDWREQARSFSDLAYFNLRWNGNLETGRGPIETLKTTFTTWNLFRVLGVDPVLGRGLTNSDDEPNAPRVMLISGRLWQREFGSDPKVIGRVVRLDGELRVIVGVMPGGFQFPSQSDIWVPMAPFFGKAGGRGWRADQAIARLKSTVTIAQAQAEMQVIAARLATKYPETNQEVSSAVMPLRAPWVGDVESSLAFLLAACGGVLLLGCLNVSQLLLTRATTREHELAIRSALGATRAQLARQLFTESALLTLLGAGAGVALAFWLIDLIRHFIPVELPFWLYFDVNGFVLLASVAVTTAAALFSGFLPARKAMAADASHALKAGGARISGDRSSAQTREILTILQVALSLMLLIGAGLVSHSLTNLRQINPGFDPHRVLMMEVNPTWNSSESAQTRIDRYQRIADHLAKLSAVEAVAANNSPPFIAQHPWNRTDFAAEGQSVSEQSLNSQANFQTVSADYFRVLRIPIVRGRAFDARDQLQSSPLVCIISQRLARTLWRGRDPVGRKIRLGAFNSDDHEEWMTVVGVAGNVRHQSLATQPGLDIYKPTSQLAWKQMHYLVRLRSDTEKNPLSLFATLRREIAKVAPEVGVFNPVSLEDELGDSLWQPRLRAWLLGFFSCFALLLAAAGLYGVVAFGVAQRTREIGIRMVLGATPSGILRLVVRQGMRAVAIGLVLGVIAAWVLARGLEATLFGIGETDPWSYVVASLLFLAAALTACWLPARRAAYLNPGEALRAE